jgi:hypothetical protein
MKNINAVETAKRLREELKRHFPKTKFYIRASTYSGGSSISVSWIDGITEKQVKEITNQFKASEFDPMQDLKNVANDGLGVDFIFTNREISPAMIVNISNLILKSFGIDKAVETIEQAESFKLSDYKENPKYHYLGQYARHIASMIDFTSITDLENFVKNNL